MLHSRHMGSDDLFGCSSPFRRFRARDGDEYERLRYAVICPQWLDGLGGALLSHRHLQHREDRSLKMLALVAVWAEGFAQRYRPNGKAEKGRLKSVETQERKNRNTIAASVREQYTVGQPDQVRCSRKEGERA